MTAQRPPALALWLLRRFVTSKWQDALTGDVLEEYERRRSAWWCWRQVLAAVAASTWMELSGHKLLALRAVVVGFASFALFAALLTRFGLYVLSPWIPAPWWMYQPAAPRGVDAIAAALMCVASFGSGWVVGRLHRTYHASMLLAYFAAFLLWMGVVLAFVPQRVPVHSYAYNFTAWSIVLTLYAASVLLGGLCSTPPSATEFRLVSR